MKTRNLTAAALAAALLTTGGLPALAAGENAPNAVRLMDPAAASYTGDGTQTAPYCILMEPVPGKELPNTAPSKFWKAVLDDRPMNVRFEQRSQGAQAGELLCSYRFGEDDIVPEHWDQNFTMAFRLSPYTRYQWENDSLELAHVWKGDFSTYWTDWEYRVNVAALTADSALSVPAEQQLHAGDQVLVTHYGDYVAQQTNRGQDYEVDFATTTNAGPAEGEPYAAYTPWSRELTVESDGFLTFSGEDMMTYGGNYRLEKVVPLVLPELKAVGQNKQVDLSWTAVAGAAGYTVQQDGVTVATLPADAHSYTVAGLENGQTYTFTLTAQVGGKEAVSEEVRSIPNSAGPQNSRPGGQGAGDGSGAVTHPLGVKESNAQGTNVSPDLDEIWLWFTHNVTGSGLAQPNLDRISLEGPDGTVPTKGYAVDTKVDFNHRQFLFLKLEQPLRPSTEYTIRIGKGIQANNGTSTDAEQVLTFTTAAAAPVTTEFVDMKGHWASKAVDFVTQKGLFGGTSADTFSPDLPLTRGMFVTVLWRLAGTPEATTAAAYTDVSAKAYYADAVAWASENNIVNGVGDGLFAPNVPVSREQLAAILYRYQNNPETSGSVAAFADADQISGYARNAMCWAVEQGLLGGITADTLVPRGTANRAQAATILMRFVLTQQ